MEIADVIWVCQGSKASNLEKLPLLRFEDSSFLKHPDLNRIRDGLSKKRTPILPRKSSDIFFHVQMYPERLNFNT